MQLGDVFDLSVSLEHHEVVLGDDEVDVDHLLANLPSLFALLRQLELDLLLAREDFTVTRNSNK